ncbi:hypothetical protein F4779DRAFT_592362 [Xylariaceae sp. FL0662B]|nr:hypothetical protein F4779DRAFT_592362 [Xylariaceae sp. FL0662B]
MVKLFDHSDGKAATDAVSLRTNPGGSSTDNYMYDADDNDVPEISVDDLPPSYNDAFESESAPMLPPIATPATAPPARPYVPDGKLFEDLNTGAQRWVAKSLEDPANLEAHIRKLAAIPPRPYVKIIGTHTETTKDSKGKTEKRTITDFDVLVELTPYLYSDAQYHRSWTQLRTIDNGEKARRGTVLKRRAPGSRQHIEVGGDPKPTLQEWCHRYGASHAGLKVFTLQRKMVGFDEEGVIQRLRSLVYDTNYRGHLRVNIVTKDELVECFNEARINRWRLTSWVLWLFILTLMIIFSWPYLWLRTKRWEVAIAEWPFSRIGEAGSKEYVSISEDQWYNMWARAISKAVLEKRQAILDQSDLRRANEPEPAFNTAGTGVDGSHGIFRASIHAMNEVNRQLGWGGDR